jgi:hypothetical protein
MYIHVEFPGSGHEVASKLKLELLTEIPAL